MLESTPIIWAKTVTEAHEFRREQDQLGRVWTLLGINHDVAHDGDWFCATLGGRSIFVQRFGVAIKVFENRCAHRFFPLRTAKKGKGPVVCDFHHWRYDQDGRAVGRNAMTPITPGSQIGAQVSGLTIAPTIPGNGLPIEPGLTFIPG